MIKLEMICVLFYAIHKIYLSVKQVIKWIEKLNIQLNKKCKKKSLQQ